MQGSFENQNDFLPREVKRLLTAFCSYNFLIFKIKTIKEVKKMKVARRLSFVLAVIGFFAWLILPGVTIAADRDWHTTEESLNDAPLKDTMLCIMQAGQTVQWQYSASRA